MLTGNGLMLVEKTVVWLDRWAQVYRLLCDVDDVLTPTWARDVNKARQRLRRALLDTGVPERALIPAAGDPLARLLSAREVMGSANFSMSALRITAQDRFAACSNSLGYLLTVVDEEHRNLWPKRFALRREAKTSN